MDLLFSENAQLHFTTCDMNNPAEIQETLYLFSSPICHFERSEKSVPFCVDNTDFSGRGRIMV